MDLTKIAIRGQKGLREFFIRNGHKTTLACDATNNYYYIDRTGVDLARPLAIPEHTLLEDIPTEELPLPRMVLVCDYNPDELSSWSERELISVLPSVKKGAYIVSQSGDSYGWSCYNYMKELPKVKEVPTYTPSQLREKIGEFKLDFGEF